MWAQANLPKSIWLGIGTCLALLLLLHTTAYALTINPYPIPTPESNSYGLVAVKKQPAPTQGATITTPGNNTAFATSPITVSGVCPNNLLVEIYDNNVMAGAVDCENGSFTLQVSLFAGENDLTANVYDDIGQSGPVSNTVVVTYNNTSFSAFGTLITLTSNYGRRAANMGSNLAWPIQLSGGAGPYAIGIIWGDGSKNGLISQPLAGTITLNHVYAKAGIYHMTIQATDAHGASAFLQLLAVVNGGTSSGSSTKTSSTSSSKQIIIVQILWIPTLVCFALLFPAYWLGRRSQKKAIRNELEKEVLKYRQGHPNSVIGATPPQPPQQ